MEFFVYILKSLKDGHFYIGQTNNLTNRLLRHNNGEVASTKNRRPIVLIYKESFQSRAEAINREKYLKSLKSSVYIKNKIIGIVNLVI
jgi:putative endonuclease